jgi:hypothetical protein
VLLHWRQLYIASGESHLYHWVGSTPGKAHVTVYLTSTSWNILGEGCLPPYHTSLVTARERSWLVNYHTWDSKESSGQMLRCCCDL